MHGGHASHTDRKAVVSACLIQRNICGKSSYVHLTSPFGCLASTVIVRRHLGDQERKLLSHIAADKKLLRKIGVSIGERKDYFDDFACLAQSGWAHFYTGQRRIAPVSLG